MVVSGTRAQQIIAGIINLVVGVIVAIFRFIEGIIRSIIDKILGVFSADAVVDSDNSGNGPLLSFFPARNGDNNNMSDESDNNNVPVLQTIYETLVQGVEAVGLSDVTQLLSDNGGLLDGVLELGVTTAPLVLMEFIGVSAANAILCVIGATESVIDGYVMMTSPDANDDPNKLALNHPLTHSPPGSLLFLFFIASARRRRRRIIPLIRAAAH
jgi:hypothetical protein